MGATFAHLAHKAGKRCLVVEKSDHTGGNVYCREVEGILDGRAPSNLEEQAMTLVGRDIYETWIKGYTEKQWGACVHRIASLHHPPPAQEQDVIFAGRLAEYRYYDMAPTIERAMQLWQSEKLK